ncbi:MAG: c-type cytochrome [Bacteroidetes bacterium]|nr:c-type cytochrome [Bacteroidota bacterium]
MYLKRKFSVTLCIVGLTGICIAATSPGAKDNGYKNLKVLPKNISKKKLQEIMIDDFEDGLGVNCGFCHAEQKGSHKLDYASDEKPEKEIARVMMRMTGKLNKNYFQTGHAMIGDSTLIVTCSTCHRGQPRPDADNIK